MQHSVNIGDAAEAISRGQNDGDDADTVGDEDVDYVPLHGGSSIDGMSVIPGSLCMACGGVGVTRIMMTKVPYFRELLLSSFACDECSERNTEVQFGGELQAKGVKCVLECSDMGDLNRQLIKSDTARILVAKLDLEIPAMTQRGVATTIEGVLRRASKELGALQAERLVATPEAGLAVQKVIEQTDSLADGDGFPFKIEIIDPAGNSFIEPLAESIQADPKLTQSWYARSDADDILIGLRPGGQAGASENDETTGHHQNHSEIEGVENLVKRNTLEDQEVMSFAVSCPHCGANGEEQMCVAQIPFFKECVIMSFSCACCGLRNSEIKGGGAIPSRGLEARLTVMDERDLGRDILKSDTASLEIPELELELARGSLGGLYTTVEGALKKVQSQLTESNPFGAGDSSDAAHRAKYLAFIQRLQDYTDGKVFPFTLIVRDPISNSFVGPRRENTAAYPDEDGVLPIPKDDQLLVTGYTRSWDEDEELGLHDMDLNNNNNLETIGEDDEADDERPHEPPQPNRVHVDHPNPNFAKGCDDNLPAPHYQEASQGDGDDDDKPPLPPDCL